MASTRSRGIWSVHGHVVHGQYKVTGYKVSWYKVTWYRVSGHWVQGQWKVTGYEAGTRSRGYKVSIDITRHKKVISHCFAV